METLTINRNSWHARLAFFYGPLQSWDDCFDFCKYTRAVITGAFFVSIITLVLSAISYALMDFCMWLFVSYQAGTMLYVSEGAGITLSVFVIIIALLAWKAGKKTGEYSAKFLWRGLKTIQVNRIESTPQIHHWWDALKQKVCFKIIVK